MRPMLVGGEARDGAGGDRLEVLDPATSELVDTVPAGTPADVDAAVEAAQAAFAGCSASASTTPVSCRDGRLEETMR